MRIDQVRNLIRNGHYAVTDHAITEGLKDGLTVGDMVQALLNGKIIERYPERHRYLIFGSTTLGLPIHVVIDFSTKFIVDIITAYIPQGDQWIKSQVRKRKNNR